MRISDTTDTIVLVEGESDRAAILALAAKLGRDFGVEHVEVVALGGATNVEAAVTSLRQSGTTADIVGLCDANERRYFDRVLSRSEVFVCDADLEEELIRAIGVSEIEQFIESQDELKTFRTYQKQPAQQGRSLEDHVHRFCGTRAGRKIRYAEAMVDWLPADRVPTPLITLINNL